MQPEKLPDAEELKLLRRFALFGVTSFYAEFKGEQLTKPSVQFRFQNRVHGYFEWLLRLGIDAPLDIAIEFNGPLTRIKSQSMSSLAPCFLLSATGSWLDTLAGSVFHMARRPDETDEMFRYRIHEMEPVSGQSESASLMNWNRKDAPWDF